jgi:hypothetical protein
MTDTYTKAVVDCATGKVSHLPMTAEEIADHKKVVAEAAEAEAKRLADEEAKADAKLAAQAKLQALGLTGEEIAAITE